MASLDYRYLYFLRYKPNRVGDKIIVLAYVKIPYARSREKRLHDMFSCSRFTIKGWKDKPLLESYCKIGIATSMSSRLITINKDILSGKTE